MGQASKFKHSFVKKKNYFAVFFFAVFLATLFFAVFLAMLISFLLK